MRATIVLLALALPLVLAGCAVLPPKDARVERVDPGSGYRAERILNRADRNDPETLLLLAFSGGGTRAAALAYGVLEELRRTPVAIEGRPSRMLDQIDAISSVSGGTFTALAYALYGERLFEVFEPRFLDRDVEGELISQLVSPLSWPSLLLGGDTRSDLAAATYDRLLFDGATYADIQGKPGPLVVASSTDFSTGYRFTFVQGSFDLICSNLLPIRLSVAATASSAVPVAFAPVTLRNWGGTCGLGLPDWITLAGRPRDIDSMLLQDRIRAMLALQDSAVRPWLHLVDGGVSDNLGLRAIIDLLEVSRTQADIRERLGVGQVRRVAVIVVNALSAKPPDWGRSPTGPGLFETILQSASVPIDRNSMDTLVLMQAMIDRRRLEQEVATLEARLDDRRAPAPGVEFFPIVLAFDDLSDADERAFLNALPTTLSLPKPTVDRLRAAGAQLLRESPEWRKFRASFDAPR